MRLPILGVTALAMTLFSAPANAIQANDEIQERFSEPTIDADTPDIEIPDFVLEAPEDTGAQFTLNNIEFLGATVFTDDELRSAVREYFGRSVGLTELYDIARIISARYRNAGYVISFAIVPPQEVREGVASILVVEGFIADIGFEGVDGSAEKLLSKSKRRVTDDRPLRLRTLENYILQLDNLPGFEARSVLAPSETEVGGSDLTIIGELDRFSAYGAVNNRGSEAIGPIQAYLSLNANSLLFGFDQLTVTGAIAVETDELRYISARYSLPLLSPSARLYAGFSYSESEPGNVLDQFNIVAESIGGYVGAEWTAYRSRAFTATTFAEFEIQNSESITLGLSNSDDRIRTLKTGALFLSNDTIFGASMPAYSSLELAAVIGIDVFNASSGSGVLSRANGQSEFIKFTFEASRYQRLAERTFLSLNLKGQYADSPLLAAQEIGFGGTRFGRGYSPSEIGGDHGIAASIQLERRLPSIFSERINPTLYGFYDYAAIRNRDELAGVDPSDELSSAGGGVKFEIMDRVRVGLEGAVPLSRGRAASGNRNAQFLFDIAVSF